MASIREVAKLANVSPATVSRVMNGTANVDADKKERVLRAIAETGFVPNEVARSLFKKSAKTIGLIVPSIENPFFTQLASVIEKTADEYGYRLLLCNTGNMVEKEKTMIQMLTSMNADGIIITTSNEEVKPLVDACNIPIVITDRRLEKVMSCDYVHCDHYEGGKLATKHLVECGCKNIVCLRGPQDVSSAKARYEGYRYVCKELHIKEQFMDCDYDFEQGLIVTEKLLEQFKDVDGIIACNDMVAISVYKVLHKRGIKVPDQVQLIGFDDVQLARLLTPELTTIAQPIDDIGKKAAELIINKDKSNVDKQEYIFKGQLVKRETTKN
ncbi:MAG: LacI family transcriptional regulator [Lachnospiraceae bacterium]|nr:LacI family transcriptional regulator [Lachnospiraceae bacterium]